MLADERLGDFRTIGDFGFPHPVPRLSRASSFITRLDAGHTVALDDPIAAAWFTAEAHQYPQARPDCRLVCAPDRPIGGLD